MPFAPPYEPFWWIKIQKSFSVKIQFFFGINHAPMTILQRVNEKWMPNSKSAHQNTTGDTTPEKWHMTWSKVSDLGLPRLTSGRSQYQCKPWMSSRNTYPCPSHQQKYRSLQVKPFTGQATVYVHLTQFGLQWLAIVWTSPGTEIAVMSRFSMSPGTPLIGRLCFMALKYSLGWLHGDHGNASSSAHIQSPDKGLRCWNGTERKFRLIWPWKSGQRS